MDEVSPFVLPELLEILEISESVLGNTLPSHIRHGRHAEPNILKRKLNVIVSPFPICYIKNDAYLYRSQFRSILGPYQGHWKTIV